MIEVRQFLLGYVLNSLWVMPVLALAGWGCARLLRRVGPAAVYRLWVVVLAAGVVMPVVCASDWFLDYFGRAFGARTAGRGDVTVNLFAGHGAPAIGAAGWQHGALNFALPSLADGLFVCWLAAAMYRVAYLLWGWLRMRRLVRNGREAELPAEIGCAWEAVRARFGLARVRVLVSKEIAAPATLGVRRAVILLPEKLMQEDSAAAEDNAASADFAAVFAHEAAHIRRWDFLWNVLYEAMMVPLAWHPVTYWVRSQMSQAREMVCDEMAADHMADAAGYARSLVRIAGRIVGARSAPAPALGIFEGGNFERRVMRLMQPRVRWSRRVTAIAVVGVALIFGSCCVAASAFNFQPAAVMAAEMKPYAGTWHWVSKGNAVREITLVPWPESFKKKPDDFQGIISYPGNYHLNLENSTQVADYPAVGQITRSYFAGGRLHLLVAANDSGGTAEWTMKLVGADRAEFVPPGFVTMNGDVKPRLAVREDVAQTVAKDCGGDDCVVPLDKVDVKPTVSYRANAEYTAAARAKKTHGIVNACMWVTTDGKPTHIRVMKGLGDGLDEAAVKSLSQWRFAPAMKDGRYVTASDVCVEINFQMY